MTSEIRVDQIRPQTDGLSVNFVGTLPPTFNGVPLAGGGGGGGGGGGAYSDPRPVLTTPATPTLLTATGTFKSIILGWRLPAYLNHSYIEVWRRADTVPGDNSGNNRAGATLIGTSTSNIYTDVDVVLGSVYWYWVRAINFEGTPGLFNAGATSGVSAGAQRINGTDLSALTIEAGNLNSGVISASKLAASAINDFTKFANGLEPIVVVASLPDPASYLGPKLVLLSSDRKIYRYTGTAWTTAVPAADVGNGLTNAQIASLDAAKLIGTLDVSRIAAGALDRTKFASSIDPVVIVTGVPGSFVGTVVYDTTTKKVYRWNGSVYTASVAGADIVANSITAGQIQAGAIGVDQIAARAITVDKLLVTGQGTALNLDPGMTDATAWVVKSNVTFTTISDGPVGSTVARSNVNVPGNVISTPFPVNPLKTYKIRARVRPVGSNGIYYLVVRLLDSTGADIGRDGTFWYYPIAGVTPGAGWNTYTGTFGAGQGYNAFPSNAQNMAVGSLLNYGGTAGYMEVQDLRIEEMVGADLVVDGAITTNSMAANTINGDRILANTMTAAKLIAGSITTDRFTLNSIGGTIIQDGTLSANKIVANSITAGQIQAAAITSTEIAAGAITTDKLLVTGKGAALNADPYLKDISAWNFYDGTMPALVSISDGISGNFVFRFTGMGAIYSNYFGVSIGRTYRVSLYARRTSGSGAMYLRLMLKNSVGTTSQRAINTIYPAIGSNLEGVAVTSGWTRYAGYLQIPSDSTWTEAAVAVYTNYNTSGVTDIQDFRCDEYVGADLIVDGAISANKISAGAIVAGKLAASAIVAGDGVIGNLAIDNAMIANGTIQAAKIGSIDAGSIVTGTLNADRIAAGSIAAGKIVANGLSIYNYAGTLILDASGGTPLNWSNLGGQPSSIYNTNITIDSVTGQISNIGSGSGTSVANNQDSIIRSPGGGIYTTTSSTVYGALRIRLPVGFTDTMIRFSVDIFEYGRGLSCSLDIAGYNGYLTGSTGHWYNVSAKVVGGSNVEYPAFFGYSTVAGISKCTIWIDVPSTSTTWSYPQVRVRDVFLGFNYVSKAAWENGWNVDFSTTTITNGTGTEQYSDVVLDTYPAADWTKLTGTGKPANFATVGARAGVDLVDSGGGVLSDGAIKNSVISLTATGALINAGGGQLETIPVLDRERETNRPPSWYPVGTTREFKHAAALGLSDGDGTWVTLETIKQYPDSGGGFPGYQYAYQQSVTWRRQATSDAGTGWTSWVKDLDTYSYTGELDATRGARAGVNLLDNAGSVLNDTSIKNSNVYLSTTGALVNAGGGQLETIPVLDREREINRPPNWYSVGTTREFKHAAALGLSDANGYWVTLETIKQFADGGGGFPGYQYAYQQSLTFRRQASNDAGTGWASWFRDLDTYSYTGDLDATNGAPSGTYVAGTPAATVVTYSNNGNSAYNAVNDSTTGLNSRLRNNADNVLGGIMSVNAVSAPAGFKAGTLTWDNAGDRLAGYGVAMTPKGLVGYNSSGTQTFNIDANTGAAYFGGTLTAPNMVSTVNMVNNSVSKVIGATVNYNALAQVTLVVTSDNIPAGQSTVPVIIIGSTDVFSVAPYMDITVVSASNEDWTQPGNLLSAQPPAGVSASVRTVNLSVGTWKIGCYNRGGCTTYGGNYEYYTRVRSIAVFMSIK